MLDEDKDALMEKLKKVDASFDLMWEKHKYFLDRLNLKRPLAPADFPPRFRETDDRIYLNFGTRRVNLRYRPVLNDVGAFVMAYKCTVPEADSELTIWSFYLAADGSLRTDANYARPAFTALVSDNAVDAIHLKVMEALIQSPVFRV